MNTHTPGAWYTSDKGTSSPHYQGQVAVEETGRTIAITYDDEGGYNAHLIAAAPDGLALAQLIVQMEQDGERIDSSIVHAAYNLITRATGRERGE